jgi:hypothetical protein
MNAESIGKASRRRREGKMRALCDLGALYASIFPTPLPAGGRQELLAAGR